MVVANDHLGNVCACASAGVGDVECDTDFPIRGRGGNSQILVRERSIRKPVAKGKQRLNPGLVIVTIADKDSLGIFNFLAASFWIVAVVRGIVLPAALNRDR